MQPEPTLRGDALRTRFAELTDFLRPLRRFWSPRPYLTDEVAWELEASALSQWCRARTTPELDEYELDAWTLPGAPDPVPNWIDRSRALSGIGSLDAIELPQLVGEEVSRRVPGRKWAQVQAFVGAVANRVGPERTLVDWCAGKGHLGRSISRVTGAEVVLVERRPELCEAGAQRARIEGLPLRFVTADALDDSDAHDELRPDRSVVALHACGRLGEDLVRRVAEQRIAELALASCCLHRIRGEEYTPVSRLGAAAAMPLTRGDLKLATTEQVHASPAVAQLRIRGMIWRLGLDLALTDATGTDPRTRVPYLHGRQIRLPFRAFCEHQSQQHDLALPTSWDADRFLAQATERVRVMRGLGLVRWIFRRPLELWLVLDRALRLVEAGYDVEVGTFCAREVTPRNLLVLARLRDGSMLEVIPPRGGVTHEGTP